MDRLQELFNQTSEEAVLKETGPITDIYVDMDYLQDLKIGVLLNRVKVQKELEYILHKIPVYNKRYDYECAKYFSALGITETDIQKDLNDDDKIDLICFKAPFTSTYYNLLELLRMIKIHNRSVGTSQENVQLQINVTNKLYPVELLNELSTNFKRKFPGMVVEISHDQNYSQSVSDYLKKKLLFIYNLEAFLKDERIAQSFAANGDFFDKYVFSFPYVNPTLVKDPEQYETALSDTAKQINLYCDFQYFRSEIVISNK